MCDIFAEQARCRRWFVHENFADATSWNQEAVRQILDREGVEAAIADQCMSGLLAQGKKGKAMPRTDKNEVRDEWSEISAELQIRRDGGYEDQRLLGRRAKHA